MKYKKRDSVKEAIIQAKLYNACKRVGLDCDLQYAINPNQRYVSEQYRKETSIFDLVVIVGNEIVAIVEVKDTSASPILTACSQQIKRYKRHGVPVFILYSIYDIPYLVRQLLELKTKFLESLGSVKVKCLEADRLSEEKWNTKIATAFDKFNETFPGYRFTNDQSLEVIAKGVRSLGLVEVLRLLGIASNSSQFVSALNYRFKYKKEFELSRICSEHPNVSVQYGGTIQCTISNHQNRQDHIDEKLS